MSPESFTRQQKAFTIAGAMLGLLLAALDQTIVATAGPAIQRDLAIAPSMYAWITTSYLVSSTVTVPLWGKLSDLYGRKETLVAGISVFVLGSVLCGLAASTAQLVAFRALQGLGSASLFTSAFAVIADLFPPSERGRYQGLLGAVFGLSSVLGPLAGGFLTDHLGWHWVFFVNLPLGIVALSFVLARMPPIHARRTERPRLDVAGALLLVAAVVPLLLALSLGGQPQGWPWLSAEILGMGGVSAVAFVGFVLVERRAASPLVDVRLARNRVFAVGNLAAFVMGMSFLGAVVFLPLFMVNVVGASATYAGLTVTPLTLGIVGANIASGHIVSRLGRYKGLLLASIAVLSIAFAIMGFALSPDASQGGMALRMVLLGIGLGPSIPLLPLAIQNAVAHEHVGVATATATFSRQMGATVGLAVMGTVFALTLGSSMQTRVDAATAGVAAEHRAAFLSPEHAGRAAGAEQGPIGAFDAAKAKARMEQRFDAALEQARQAPDAAARVAQVETQRAAALATVDRVDGAVKQAFTDAIARLYQLGLLFTLLGMLVVLALPELPLRRTQGMPPATVPSRPATAEP